MPQSLRDLSEIVTGLVLDGRVNPIAVAPGMFQEPYDDLIKIIKTNDSWDLATLISSGASPPTIQAAQHAAKALNGLGKAVDWVEQLKEAKVREEVGAYLTKAGKMMGRGQTVDPNEIMGQVKRLVSGDTGLTTMDQVEEGEIRNIPCGWDLIDKFFGGIPEVGLVTVGAAPKMGKTSFLLRMAKSMLVQYPDKGIVIVTNEMTKSQLKARCKEIDGWTDEEFSRLSITAMVRDVNDLANQVATVTNVSFVGVDFADLLIRGQVDSAKMEEVYRVLAQLSIQIGAPILLLAQLSRGYQGGLPRPIHMRWTGMAEALSFALWMLYSPYRDYFPDQDKRNKCPLPNENGKSYIIGWLCRTKTKQEFPGAIQTSWNGEKGWNKGGGRWFSLQKGAASHDAEDWEQETEEAWEAW